MSNFICVFVGGGLGAVCRYGLICLIGMPWGLHFPLATLLINAISCFFMGLIMGLLLPLAHRLHLLPESLRLFTTVGFLGGFSTLAAFSLETFTLYRGGHHLLAGLNIIATIGVSLATVYLGWQAAALMQK